jgi:uncharacterized delta-60 repeat protein
MTRALARLSVMVLVLTLVSCGTDKSTSPASRGHWIAVIGGEEYDAGFAVVALPDGDILVAGETASSGEGFRDAYLVRLDSTGYTRWERTYGGASTDQAVAMVSHPDGGVLLLGQTQSFGTGGSDFYLIRVLNSGTLDWQEAFGDSDGELGGGIAVSDAGEIIAVGVKGLLLRQDMLVIATDLQGEILRSQSIESEIGSGGEDVIANIGDGYAVAGWVWASPDRTTDMLLIKMDADGEETWRTTYGGDADDWCNDALITDDGGFLLVGWTESIGEGDKDVYAVRTNAQGESLWETTYGGPSGDGGNAAVALPDGSFVIAGWTRSFGAGEHDVYLIKIDDTGQLLWQRTFGGEKDDIANSIATTPDGGLVIAGLTWSSGAGQADVYVIKTDANGQL